jgi:hypothetical protein
MDKGRIQIEYLDHGYLPEKIPSTDARRSLGSIDRYFIMRKKNYGEEKTYNTSKNKVIKIYRWV